MTEHAHPASLSLRLGPAREHILARSYSQGQRIRRAVAGAVHVPMPYVLNTFRSLCARARMCRGSKTIPRWGVRGHTLGCTIVRANAYDCISLANGRPIPVARKRHGTFSEPRSHPLRLRLVHL